MKSENLFLDAVSKMASWLKHNSVPSSANESSAVLSLALCLSSSFAYHKICKNPSKTVWDIPTLITAARNKQSKLSNKRRKRSRKRKIQLPSTQKREIFNFVMEENQDCTEEREDKRLNKSEVLSVQSKEEWELHALQKLCTHLRTRFSRSGPLALLLHCWLRRICWFQLRYQTCKLD